MAPKTSPVMCRPWTCSSSAEESGVSPNLVDEGQMSAQTPPGGLLDPSHIPVMPQMKCDNNTPADSIAKHADPSHSSVPMQSRELLKQVQCLRLDLRDLRESVFRAVDAAFSDVSSTLEKHLNIVSLTASLADIRRRNQDLRRCVDAARSVMTTSAATVQEGLANLSHLIRASSSRTVTLNPEEAPALRLLHESIEALIRQSGMSVSFMEKNDRQNDSCEEIDDHADDARTRHLPCDEAKSGLFGYRPWTRHDGSLVEAVPHAVAALRTVTGYLKSTNESRKLLHFRISRQERLLVDVQADLDRLRRAVEHHIDATYAAIAQVNGGILVAQQAGRSSTSEDSTSRLEGLTRTVHSVLERLALRPSLRGVASEAPTCDTRVDRSAISRSSSVDRSSALRGELAVLRHRFYQLKLRAAVQTWRFRRCALALVARHTSLSAHEATEAKLAAQSAADGDAAVVSHESALPYWKAERRMLQSGLLPLFGDSDEPQESKWLASHTFSDSVIERWRQRRSQERMKKKTDGGLHDSAHIARMLVSLEPCDVPSSSSPLRKAIPAMPPSGPRYQRPTRVSTTKQRPVFNYNRSGADSSREPHPRPVTSPRRSHGETLSGVSIRDALNAFLGGVGRFPG